MNELVVPSAPLWYKSSVLACSPDNILVYGSKNDLVVVKNNASEQPAEVKIIQGAHSKNITSVSMNRKWKHPHSYLVSLGEDSVIKVWDLENYETKFFNKDHTEHKNPVVGAVFAGDDRVVSAASTGLVIIWNINTHESRALKDLFNTKVTLTCLSSCPHAGWLLAFGLINGCVIVADLRRNGHVLYKLRGHYQAVVSLSWCPAPVNVFPRQNQNTVKNKTAELKEIVNVEQKHEEVQPVVEQEHEEVQPVVKDTVKVNPWVNLVHADDDEVAPENEDPLQDSVDDFLKECDELKSKILGLDASVSNGGASVAAELNETKSTLQYEEKGIEETKGSGYCQKIDKDRPLPKLFDPSGDFLDDSFDVCVTEEDILEDKDVGDEKTADNKESEEGNKAINKEVKENDVHELDDTKQVEGMNRENDAHEEDNTKPVEGMNRENDAYEEDLPEENTNQTKEVTRGDIKEKNPSEEKDVTNLDKTAPSEIEVAEAGEDSGISVDESSPKVEFVEEEPRTEYLLASSGKDRSVYIWRAGTDGRMQTFFHTPKRSRSRDSKNAGFWITVCWIAPDTILTSSVTGELLAWPLPKPKETNKQFKVIHFEHSSTVFNVVTPPTYFTAYNWRDKSDLTVWTWGQEGLLVNYDLNAQKILLCYATITAPITCFDSCALDPNRLAMGMRDGSIRVWDLSLAHSKIIAMRKYTQKYTHKVSTIAWNPIKEMILAFGTEEGRVGFIDMSSKNTKLFPHYFHSQVYKIEWGPINGNTCDLGIYVVAEGKVAIYDTKELNSDPMQLELPKELQVYRFAWKPDYSLLLLNAKDGSVVILNTDLVAITTVYLSDKGLNEIVWHPDAFINTCDISARCNWFAAATSKGLLIYDCALLKEDASKNGNFMDNVVVMFEGHLKPPLSIAWCPFDGNRVVSSAADGLTHVWDVVTKSAIATFDHPYFHYSPAVVWSPIDPDLIILGDKIIKICSISKNPPKNNEEFLATRKRLLAKASKTEPDKSDKNKIKVDIPPINSCPKNSIVPAMYVANDDNLDLQIAQMRKLMADKENKTFSDNDNPLDPLQLFGEKEQVTQLLTANYENQKKQHKHKSCELISLWKGNLGEYIEAAISENRITPTIISLAPMVSLKLWQDSCEVYAKKLSETADSNPLETAMYFLACHKIEEAINCLCLSFMFKEALALAKHRLPENSDYITEVTEKWARYCINTGNFETAAFCYISLQQYTNAAQVLSRRNNREFLEFAAELAEKDGNKGLYDSIKFKSNEIQLDKSSSSDLEAEKVEILPSRVEALIEDIKGGCEEKDRSEGETEEENLHLESKIEEKSSCSLQQNDASSSSLEEYEDARNQDEGDKEE